MRKFNPPHTRAHRRAPANKCRLEKIWCDVWKQQVGLVWGGRYQDRLRAAKRYMSDDKLDLSDGGAYTLSRGDLVMIMINCDREARRCVIHECGHAAFHILFQRGVTISMEENEAYCYTLDCLSDQCLGKMGL